MLNFGSTALFSAIAPLDVVPRIISELNQITGQALKDNIIISPSKTYLKHTATTFALFNHSF